MTVRIAMNVRTRISALAVRLIISALLVANAPFVMAAPISPWDVQKALGRGGNAILDTIDPDRKSSGKPAQRRVTPKKKFPIVRPGKQPPVPLQRPSGAVDIEGSVAPETPPEAVMPVEPAEPAATEIAETPERADETPSSQFEDSSNAPGSVNRNVELLGPQSVEPRESAPLLKPVPGGPLPAGKPVKKRAVRPTVKPADKPGGARPAAKSKSELRKLPAGTTAVTPLTEAKPAAVCRIANATIERVEQPEPGDLSCNVERPVALKDLGWDTVVTFSPQAVLDCEMAETVAAWVREVVRPAVKDIFGTSLKKLRVASSFACRRRNNLPDGKLSEHGRGNAIDISAFTLGDGRVITVRDGWRGEAEERKFLARVRKKACETFTTVLSPDGDAYHQNHLHLDVGCHGKTCTYRICD